MFANLHSSAHVSVVSHHVMVVFVHIYCTDIRPLDKETKLFSQILKVPYALDLLGKKRPISQQIFSLDIMRKARV